MCEFYCGTLRIPLIKGINRSNCRFKDANYVRQAWEGAEYGFFLQEGIDYKNRQYNVICFTKGGDQVFLGVIYRIGKSWRYRTPYSKNGIKIQSKKKSSSIIKAVKSMFLKLGVLTINGLLNDVHSGLYITSTKVS